MCRCTLTIFSTCLLLHWQTVGRPRQDSTVGGQALDYLHFNKVVHGDLKPENVLMSARGAVTLSDFGCSKLILSGNEYLERCNGTPAFLAPEMMKPHSRYRYALLCVPCADPPCGSAGMRVLPFPPSLHSPPAFPLFPSSPCRSFALILSPPSCCNNSRQGICD